jgi:mevalonate kinase
LEGAQALAIPTRFGQRMSIKQTKKSDLVWYSYDVNGQEWFKAQISLMDFSAVKTTNEPMAKYLQKLLKGAVRLNSEFLSKWNGFDVKTYLEFPNDWGLGSSSSLTYLLAQWADVNPLLLHFQISEGSGYDVACAGADSPINYRIEDDTINYSEIDFEPSFKDDIYFIHMNEKVSSKDAVEYYFKNVKSRKTLVKKISELTEHIIKCTSFKGFCELINEHEAIMSEALKMDTVKNKYFSDFEGSIKSLGAWGGDFVMACSKQDESVIQSYFEGKGFNTILPYREMIYTSKEASSLSAV